MRPHHQPQLSAGGRPANLHSPHEQPSAAAQRYSPMEALSPTSPYGPKASQFSGPPSQTQSPAAGVSDFPQSPYYAGRQQNPQLPPMSPYSATPDGYPSAAVATLDHSFGNSSKSPQRQPVPAVKPVPEFRKVRAMSDLHPKKTRQPPFRRANPEGGFISVCFFCCVITCLLLRYTDILPL
jgi:dual specificity protein kinase YAK1